MNGIGFGRALTVEARIWRRELGRDFGGASLEAGAGGAILKWGLSGVGLAAAD